MPTKRNLIQNVVSEAEAWLETQGIIDRKSLAVIRDRYAITLQRIVAMTEKFAIEPFKQGQIYEYVRAEYEKGTILAGRFAQMGADEPILKEVMSKKLTLAQLDQITSFVVQIIKIILM